MLLIYAIDFFDGEIPYTTIKVAIAFSLKKRIFKKLLDKIENLCYNTLS